MSFPRIKIVHLKDWLSVGPHKHVRTITKPLRRKKRFRFLSCSRVSGITRSASAPSRECDFIAKDVKVALTAAMFMHDINSMNTSGGMPWP